MDAFQTHVWSDDDQPHIIEQDGKTIQHRRCLRCGRDFARGMDGAAWDAVYLGVFKVEFLADSVSKRWLREECPKRLRPEDDASRALRRL